MRISDWSSDVCSSDLLPLSASASRAETHGGYAVEPVHVSDTPASPVTAREIRDMLRLRRLRDRFFPGDLFADPAWDMLLDLMAAHLSGQRVSVSSLRSEENTSELQSLMRISYAVF